MGTRVNPYTFAPEPEPVQPADIQARTRLLELFQRGLPGYPTDDRYAQTLKYTGIVYIALRPLLKAVRKADVVALRRRPRRGRVTFGPGGVVAKSVTAGYGKSQRDDYVPLDPGHPVCRVLDRPQQKDGPESMGAILEYFTLQGRLTGTSPLWCVPSEKYLAAGEWRPVQLYALPTALTVPQPGGNARYPFGYYRVQPYHAAGGYGWLPGLAGGAAGTLLDGREVKRRLYPHPLYRWDGYSPLTACSFLIDLVEQIDQARWAAMQHGTTPDIILTMSGADQPTIDRIKETWTAKNGGARRHRSVAIVSTAEPEGKVDVKTPNLSAKDMDFQGGWEQVVSAVLAAFGVPHSVVFPTGGYAENYAAQKFFHQTTVQPECEEVGEFLTTAVAEPWSDEPGEICIEVIPPEPQNEEVTVISALDRLQTGAWTVNQVRASQNEPPVPGGDVPLSVYIGKAGIAAGTAPDPTKPPPAPPGKPAPGETPTGGAPPKPENPDAEGSKPPAARKSMSSLEMSAGGALVPPAGRKLGRRKSRRYLRRVLRGAT